MMQRHVPPVPLDEDVGDVASQRTPWRIRVRLSSVADRAEDFLAASGFDRGPWLAVAFATGIALWFWLSGPAQWVAVLGLCGAGALGALALWKSVPERSSLVAACVTIGVLVAAGLSIAWARSEMVGAEPLPRPAMERIDGRILQRVEQPSQDRVRLVLAARHPDTAEPIKLRVNVPLERDAPGLTEGAVVRLTARLMPPASPMLPGGYDFARAAWFQGYAATGSVVGEVELLEAGKGALLAPLQRRLADHVRSRLDGAPGTIAATFASGDRGAISQADQVAMRDAGLTHLLAISGLHVSALIGGTYLLAMRLLALWPWLVLRVRLPLAAAIVAAMAGIAYTLLTGAQVPTVRACIGAVLVLIALAMGRDALTLRMVAVAAISVLLLWPEVLVGPSFQMSFTAVLAIVALHSSAPVRKFMARREEAWLKRMTRATFMLLITGLVIELALMPIVLFHFHRAGVYGALANVIAIPLVTFAAMPMIALALVLDIAGLGAPGWWLAGKSLEMLLWIAHFTASQPGAVKLLPQMTDLTFAMFLCGGLWLALWRGAVRLWGGVPIAAATFAMLTTPVPDVLISGDGRHVGITGEGDSVIALRDMRSSFTRENLMELAGEEGQPVPMAQWPGAQCSPDFCTITINRAGRDWHILMSRSSELVEERALAAACERSDIVVSERWLPRACKPRWLKADRRMLSETGGLAIVLDGQNVTSVADRQGQHGWWRGETPRNSR